MQQIINSKHNWTIAELARAYEKKNKGRNMILKITTALTCLLFFLIFSLAFGKLNIDRVRSIRENGMAVSAYLENGTEKNEKEIRRLTYVNEIGREKFAGVLMKNGREYSTCAVLDEIAYEEMISPAYTDIHGTYPRMANEIMMSDKSLSYLGINNPEIGMKIMLDFHWLGMNDNNIGVQEFVLSGYYQDYTDDLSGTSTTFISQKRLEESNVDLYSYRILIDIKPEYISGNQIADALYNDVLLTRIDQRFVGMDPPGYTAIKGMLGGYGMALLLGMLVLLTLYLLSYNVFLVSLNQDMKQYGLLRIMGATKKQIRKLISLQIRKIAATGILSGVATSIPAAFFFVPPFLRKMYFGNTGNLETVKIYNVAVLGISIFFTFMILVLSTRTVIRKIKKLSTIENFIFNDINSVVTDKSKINLYHKKHVVIINKKSQNISFINRIAFQNILRSKSRFIFTMFSLVLGCEIALCASVITKGIDITNQLSRNSDFEIGIAKEALRGFPYRKEVTEVNKETIFDYTIFTDEMIFSIAEIADRKVDEVNQVYGCFAGIDDIKRAVYYSSSKEEQVDLRNGAAFEPIYNSDTGIWIGVGAGYYGIGIIGVADDEYVNKLKKYTEEYEIRVDLSTFIESDGVLLLHENVLKTNSKNQVKDTVGKPIWLYPVAVQYPGEPLYLEKGKLINCGYLNVSEDHFPKLQKTWEGDDMLYCIITEKTFAKLNNLPKQTMQINFDVVDTKEEKIKKELQDWVREQNINFRNEKKEEIDIFYIISNSDVMEEQKNYIEGSRTIMNIISVALLMIGIMNYFNTSITGIITRKNEFALLRCIGMTGKQLQRMLAREGICYCCIAVIILLTMGNGILFALSLFMKSRIPYFEFIYPVSTLSVIIVLLSILCMGIPLVIYYQISKVSAMEYHRMNI